MTENGRGGLQWPLGSKTAQRVIFVALCFALTSVVYLHWLNRLIALTGGQAADWLSMVAGYLFQAVGIGASLILLRNGERHQRNFIVTLAFFMAVTVPALTTNSVAGVIVFGLLMNGLCGVIAGFYLYGIGKERKSLIFGCGYATATIAVGLLYLIGNGVLLHGNSSLLLYLVLVAGLAWMTVAQKPIQTTLRTGSDESDEEKKAFETPAKVGGRAAVLAGVAVVLISLAKNLGFGFPSADIEAGLIPELSRIPYALGLIAAGFLNDKNRRYGSMCTISALIVPFIMLGLADEPISSWLFWGLDYIFFGFFSVYRVVLFLDIAEKAKRWELAPLGLLLGRIGDAGGTAMFLLLKGQTIVLIAVAAVLFVISVFMLINLHRNLYEPETVQVKNEQAFFESFSIHHDLSMREKEVFRMLLDGRTNAEIAGALFITENTVKYHVKNILLKAGSKNRVDLQRKYNMALYPEMMEEKPKGKRI